MVPFQIHSFPRPRRWIAGSCSGCCPGYQPVPVSTSRSVCGTNLAAPALGQAAAAWARWGSAGRGPLGWPGGPWGDQHTRPHSAGRSHRTHHGPRRRGRGDDACAPKPIDHFLLQADLTVVVPGPLERDLAEQLATVATVESAGAAMVYRISEQSIRHAFDVGKTRDWMRALFTKHSKTPVPQGLTYLIDDVARRHGQLRIGMAASFVRCEDPALLAQAVAAPAAEQLQLRALARQWRCHLRRSPKCWSRYGPRASPRPPRIPRAPSSTSGRTEPVLQRRSSAAVPHPVAPEQ